MFMFQTGQIKYYAIHAIRSEDDENDDNDNGDEIRLRQKAYRAQLKNISYIYSTYLHSPSRRFFFGLFPFWWL